MYRRWMAEMCVDQVAFRREEGNDIVVEDVTTGRMILHGQGEQSWTLRTWRETHLLG
jgi:hypothetical protein